MDDVELCERMRANGWDVWYVPTAKVVHYMSQSTTREAGSASPAALRNFNTFFAERHGPAACVALRTVEAVGCGIRAAMYGLAARLRRNDPYLTGRARAHRTFARVSLEPIARTHHFALH